MWQLNIARKSQGWWIISILLWALSCQAQKPVWRNATINQAHLQRLFEPIEVQGKSMGAIWIYCEAPDYRLVADDDEGFTCVDDVARALVFLCREQKSTPGSSESLALIAGLAEYILHMQAENGYFYNFMFYEGKSINTTHVNSVATPAFWTWRAFWALSELQLVQHPALEDIQQRSKTAMDLLLRNLPNLCFEESETQAFDGIILPRCVSNLGADQASVLLLALTNYYRLYPAESIKKFMLLIGNQLLGMQRGPWNSFLSWQNYWHAWGNSQAYALLQAGSMLDYEPFIQAGLKEVADFYPRFLARGFTQAYRVVAANNDVQTHDVLQFPQIAYNIRPMVLAAMTAYEITQKREFAVTAGRLAAWLSGNNPAVQMMYNPDNGRTFDGITDASRVNQNSGAESTIEALLVLQAIQDCPIAIRAMKSHSPKPIH